jgi:hypothetical protein
MLPLEYGMGNVVVGGACLYRGKLKQDEAYPHKLVTGWTRMPLTFFFLAMPLLIASLIL